MTIRFAPARNRPNFVSAITGGCRSSFPIISANDNGALAATDNSVLIKALRHFAEHGLSAAERARENAIHALDADDGTGFELWLAICQSLDKRMANAIPCRENQR